MRIPHHYKCIAASHKTTQGGGVASLWVREWWKWRVGRYGLYVMLVRGGGVWGLLLLRRRQWYKGLW